MNASFTEIIEYEKPMEVFYYLSLIFGIILTPILTLFGIAGNLLSIVVLIDLIKRNRRKVFSLYIILISLAVSDTLILLLNFIVNFIPNCYEYIEWSWFFFPYQYQGYLIVTIWPLVMSFQMSSIYLTLLISYDRWRAICQPLRSARSMYSSKILLKIIVLIFFFCITYNIPRWLEFQLDKKNFTVPHAKAYIQDLTNECTEHEVIFPIALKLKQNDNLTEDITEKLPHLLGLHCKAYMYPYTKTSLANHNYFKYIYVSALYFAFVFLIPLIFITICNLQLVLAIQANKKQWSEISKLQRKQMHETRVPLLIVLLFYILGIPPSIINVLDSSRDYIQILSKDNELWNSLVCIGNLCVLINSSSNFVIYCMLGKKFRIALIHCLTCRNRSCSRWLLNKRILTSYDLSMKHMENSSFLSRSYYRNHSQTRNSYSKVDRIVDLDNASHKLIDRAEY